MLNHSIAKTLEVTGALEYTHHSCPFICRASNHFRVTAKHTVPSFQQVLLLRGPRNLRVSSISTPLLHPLHGAVKIALHV